MAPGTSILRTARLLPKLFWEDLRISPCRWPFHPYPDSGPVAGDEDDLVHARERKVVRSFILGIRKSRGYALRTVRGPSLRGTDNCQDAAPRGSDRAMEGREDHFGSSGAP